MTTESDSRAVRLTAKAAEAADVRAAQQSPHVKALAIEHQRVVFNVMIWAAVVIGLAYTASNVQQFAAHGAAHYSIAWWFAWGLDPTVQLALVAVLLVDQIISSHGGRTPRAGLAVKWGALVMTYLMNTWAAWSSLDARLVLLHSVPVVGVFLVVSAAPRLRDALTETITRVGAEPAGPVPQPEPAPMPTIEQPAVNDSMPDFSSPAVPDPMPAWKPAPAKPGPAGTPGPASPPGPRGWQGIEDLREVGRKAAGVMSERDIRLSKNNLKTVLASPEFGEISMGTERLLRLLRVLKDESVKTPHLHAVGGA